MSTQVSDVSLLRFKDLVERKIINNRMTLTRWINRDDDPFPSPIQLGPNSVAWDSREIEAWIQRRRAKGREAE